MPERFITTDIAKIYTWASENNIPARFVLINNNVYYNLFELLSIGNKKEEKEEKEKEWQRNIKPESLITSGISLQDIVMCIYKNYIVKGKITKEELKYINKILKKGGYRTKNTIEELEEEYNNWEKKYKLDLAETKYKAALVSKSLEYFKPDIEYPLITTKFLIKESQMSFRPEIESPDIFFDYIIVNSRLPFVKYVNKNGKVFYKIFETNTIDIDTSSNASRKFNINIQDEIKEKEDQFEDIEITETNFIVMKLKLKDGTTCELKYNLDNNYMLITNIIEYVNYKKEIIKILSDSLYEAVINLGDPKEYINVKGSFEIYDPYSETGLYINVFYFLYYIATNRIAKEYLYLQENDSFFGEKYGINLLYNKLFERYNKYSLYINFDMQIFFELKITSIDKIVNNIIIPKNNYYLKIKLNKINDIENVNDFKKVFESIYIKYNNEIDNIKIENGIDTDQTASATQEEINEANEEEDQLMNISENILNIHKNTIIKDTIFNKLKEDTDKYGLITSQYSRTVGANKADKGEGQYPSVILKSLFDTIPEKKQIMGFPVSNPPNPTKTLSFYIENQRPIFFYYDEEDADKFASKDIADFDLDLPPPDARTKLYHDLTDSVEEMRFSYKPKKNMVEFLGEFPPETIYFYCKHPQASYPGVFKNTLDNRNRYPYLPKCFTKNQIKNPNSVYNKYFITGKFEPEVIEDYKGVIQKKISVGLKPNQLGTVPTTLKNIFGQDILRLGMIRSKSSLIHCLLKATKNREYYRLKSNVDKENFVLELRQNLDQYFYPELLKQEMPNLSGDEITAYVTDIDTYFDPSLFYRVLEELYDVNIYVFNPIDRLKRKSNEDVAVFRVPKYNIFHTRPNRDYRKTVLIYENYGADAQGFDYNQCELIVKGKQMIWDSKTGDLCYEILKRTILNVTVFDKLYVNFYFNDNIELYPLKFLNQFIDNYGKMIAVNCIHVPTNIKLCMYFPPMQPLNLPQATTFELIDIKNISKVITEKPTSIDRRRGLWFAYKGIPDMIYIPFTFKNKEDINYPGITGIPDIKHLLQGPNDPLDKGYNIEINKTIIKYRLMSAIIKTLIHWLFMYWNQDNNNSMDTISFIDSMVINKDILYDFDNLQPPILPKLDNYDQALEYVENNSNLVINKQIQIRSRTLLERLEFNLNEWLDSFKNKPPVIPEFIEDFYLNNSDFLLLDKTYLFEGEDIYKQWKLSMNSFNSIYKIHYMIGNPHSAIVNPFLLVNGDKLLLITNTGEDKEEAIKRSGGTKLYIPKEGSIPDFNEPGIINYRITDSINKYASIRVF